MAVHGLLSIAEDFTKKYIKDLEITRLVFSRCTCLGEIIHFNECLSLLDFIFENKTSTTSNCYESFLERTLIRRG